MKAVELMNGKQILGEVLATASENQQNAWVKTKAQISCAVTGYTDSTIRILLKSSVTLQAGLCRTL